MWYAIIVSQIFNVKDPLNNLLIEPTENGYKSLNDNLIEYGEYECLSSITLAVGKFSKFYNRPTFLIKSF